MKQNIKPFSDNLIFLDTEFSSLNPYIGEILSIGIVKLNGEELYLELEHNGKVDDWVRDNIIPKLESSKVSTEQAKAQINEFIGKTRPYMIGIVNQFDTIYTYKLFGIENHPFYWIPIDFASILFAFGIDPERWDRETKGNLYNMLGIDLTKFRNHYALDDAKLLREVYLKFFSLDSFLIKN